MTLPDFLRQFGSELDPREDMRNLSFDFSFRYDDRAHERKTHLNNLTALVLAGIKPTARGALYGAAAGAAIANLIPGCDPAEMTVKGAYLGCKADFLQYNLRLWYAAYQQKQSRSAKE